MKRCGFGRRSFPYLPTYPVLTLTFEADIYPELPMCLLAVVSRHPQDNTSIAEFVFPLYADWILKLCHIDDFSTKENKISEGFLRFPVQAGLFVRIF